MEWKIIERSVVNYVFFMCYWYIATECPQHSALENNAQCSYVQGNPTVDGRNPAPPWMVETC